MKTWVFLISWAMRMFRVAALWGSNRWFKVLEYFYELDKWLPIKV